jgi:hypothetical protein
MAIDRSDALRARLVSEAAVPDFAADLLAPVLVFLLVVLTIRLAASIAARLLGVGLSLPSRVLASAASLLVSGVVLGGSVILLRHVRPPSAPAADPAERLIASPLDDAFVSLETMLSGSFLVPPLVRLASAVVMETVEGREAMRRFSEEADAAAEEVRQKVGEAAAVAGQGLPASAGFKTPASSPAGERGGRR